MIHVLHFTRMKALPLHDGHVLQVIIVLVKGHRLTLKVIDSRSVFQDSCPEITFTFSSSFLCVR